MVEVIFAHRPGYRFQLSPDRLDGDWRLDGDANDGSGPGRLFIAASDTPGSLTANPCADPDFTQGAACVERLLPSDDRLVLRGLVDADGVKTVVVALIHPDRSGVTAEAGNFSILGQPAPRAGQTVAPARPTPVYDVTELAELVVAIDKRLREIRGR